MEISTIARPYALALFKIAKEKKLLSQCLADMRLINLVVKDGLVQVILRQVNLSKENLLELFSDIFQKLDEAFANRLNEISLNLLKLLLENKRLPIIEEILTAYEALKLEEEGVIATEIISAIPLSGEQNNAITAQLEKRFSRKITIHTTVDPKLIAGLKVIIGDTVMDYSVQEKLRNLSLSLS